MPPFSRDTDSWPADWWVILDSVVSLFWRRALFDEAIAQLIDLGYKVVTHDAGEFAGERSALAAIGRSLDFPDYAKWPNLDGFNDCISDVATFDYGSDPASTGTAVALRNYDDFVRREPDAARVILEIFTNQARLGLLFGHRMMVLVQTNDPALEFAGLGCQSATWNYRERSPSDRGPGSIPRGGGSGQ